MSATKSNIHIAPLRYRAMSLKYNFGEVHTDLFLINFFKQFLTTYIFNLLKTHSKAHFQDFI